mmetsp:Transcript_19411/g.40443  ORF Transcript_19411/g.40443 Transcript_19411/m.40443 type:complete len:206 (+) Transcript_19411:104-721(+)
MLQHSSASKRERLKLDANPSSLRVRGLRRLHEANLDVALDQSPEGLARLVLLAHVVELLGLIPLKSKLLHNPHELLDRGPLILLESSLVIQHAQGTKVHENSCRLQVPVDASEMYGALEIVGLRIDLGSSLAEQPHNVRMTSGCSMMKSLLGITGCRMDTCLAIQHQVNNILVAFAGSPMQRSHARKGILLHPCFLVEQQLDHVV